MRNPYIYLLLGMGILIYMYREEQRRADHYRDMAEERKHSLNVADQGLHELIKDRRECIAETVNQERQLLESQQALMLCSENIVKKVYMAQVERNCTIANNRLIRLAKLQSKETL